MRSLSASELIDVWEWGINQPPLEQIFRLLAFALDIDDIRQISELSVGERDNYLFLLRRNLFGKQLNCSMNCPECGEIIEWVSNIDEFCSLDYSKQINRELSLKHKNLKLKFRLPTSDDIIQAGLNGTNADFSRNLIMLCTTEATKNSRTVKNEGLPAKILAKIEEQMEEADPIANIQLSLTCPNCGHTWDEIFDILSFFMKEVDSWVKRLLQDVSVLALNYGWSEKDILELSPLRRQFYLDAL